MRRIDLVASALVFAVPFTSVLAQTVQPANTTTAPDGAAAKPAPPAPPTGAIASIGIEQVVVRAKKLNEARSHIQPGLGATRYELSSTTLAQIAQGSNAPLNQVLLQAPGVAEDSFGQIHVRGDHNEVQYLSLIHI